MTRHDIIRRGPPQGSTPTLAAALVRSIAESPYQSAGVLAVLAGVATLGPIYGLAAAGAGAAFLAMRPRSERADPIGRPREEIDRIRRGFHVRIGNAWSTGEPVLMGRDDLTMHMLLFGTTGSGKTQNLLGIMDQVVAQGSGAMIVDGKGDASLIEKVLDMAGRYGRIEDVLVLDLNRADGQAINTLNPFARGGPKDLARLVLELTRDGGGKENGEAAEALLAAVMAHLVWLRDGGEPFGARTILDSLGLPRILRIAQDDHAPDMNDPGRGVHPIPELDVIRKANAEEAGIPEGIRDLYRRYLGFLTAYNPERRLQQASGVHEQHKRNVAVFAPTLGVLAESFGHVFPGTAGEIDLRDVVEGRRILVVTLPVLLKAGPTGAILGKTVAASLKLLLGELDGEARLDHPDAIVPPRAAKPDDAFMVILDDVGHYAVEGLALMAARARHLGFSMVYSAQDGPDLRDRAPIEGRSIIANTVLKGFMSAEAAPLDKPGGSAWYDGEPDVGYDGPGADAPVDGLKAGDMLLQFRGTKCYLRTVHPAQTPRGVRKHRLRPNVLLELPEPATHQGSDR